MAPIRDSVSHSPNQTDLEPTGLDSQYEPSSWSSGSPCSSDGNWSNVLVDGSTNKSNNSSTSPSVWPPSSSSFSCSSSSSSSSSSGCGSGSDPESASECMEADSSSPIGSERNLATAAATVMSADASECPTASTSPSASTTMAGVSVNGDTNASNHANNGNVIAGSNIIGSNNMSNHNSCVWGPPSGSNMINTEEGGTPCISGGLNPNALNPNANHGAWPQNPSPNPVSHGQHPPQAQGSHLGVAPQHAQSPGWGVMAAPENSSVMEDMEVTNGTASSNSGNGGPKPTNLNTESSGPNNTIMMNTTTITNATMTSSPPNSTASPQLSGDGTWDSIGGGTGGSLANGNTSSVPQQPQGQLGCNVAFGTPWGPNTDTVNSQTTSTAAYKSNNHKNTGASRCEQGPTSNSSQPQSNSNWGTGSERFPGSPRQMRGNGNQAIATPVAEIPRPWGSSAPASSSSSKMSDGEWGLLTSSENHQEPGSHKESSVSNGWKSLEDDAIGMGAAGGGAGNQVIVGLGCSGGSGTSSGSSSGRSSSDKDGNPAKLGNRRKVNLCQDSLLSALIRTEVDPRVLSNSGWGQTPVRQNTAWDVSSSTNREQGPKGDDKKMINGNSGWGSPPPGAPAQASGAWEGRPGGSGPDTESMAWGEQRPTSGWNGKPLPNGSRQSGWDDGCSYKGTKNTWNNNINKDNRSNTWNNGPVSQQGWGSNSGNEVWGGSGGGQSNHWGEPKKGTSSVGWDSDSDRSGSGCWSEPSRTNTSSGNTWVGSGGSNTPDMSTPNPGSNWGDSAQKPNLQSNGQGWSEPMKINNGAQTWGESKPSEWGRSNESNKSRGNPGSNKPTGWVGGPIPPVGQKEEAATGWEEPSPESIRRRMEVDDGTAAWGDPVKCSGGSVNMWNKSGQFDQEAKGSSSHQSHPAHGPMQPMPHLNQDKSCSGWGEPFPPQRSSSWREPGAAVTMDNGTSAWGKPIDGNTRWDESSKDSKESGWGGQHKSSSKPMETWGGDDISMSNSWDQEEEVEIGVWSNNPQDRSHDQNTWNYKHKGFNKMNKPGNKQDEPWMKPFVSQFNGMNLSRESPDDSKSGPLMLQDKRMDMVSVGDFNGAMAKTSGSRHHLQKDSAMDRNPYYDKNVNPMLVSSSVAQGRGGPQTSLQPNHRNQVPPPILPAQVPSNILKYPGGNGSLNPLFGPQVAVLNQLSQFNQFNQFNQIQRLILQQQQQQKAQSLRTMPVGRQSETRPIGSPSIMQQSRHLDSSLLKQPAPLKPYMDNYLSHATTEMPKDPLGSFSNITLNMNSNLNVSLDMGMCNSSNGGGAVGYKEPPQSRLKKLWVADPLEQNSKPGAMSSGMHLEDSPFCDFLSPGPPAPSPPSQALVSVGDGWSPRANSPLPHGNTVIWPPEFRPGEPWKGYPNIDPETDPFVTPGSVINNLSINTVRDTDHLRDRNNGPSSSFNTTMPSNSAWSSIRASSHSSSLTSIAQSTSARPSDSKWSPSGSVSNSSLAHELWKVPLPSKALSVATPSRPPPGLPPQRPNPISSGWEGSTLRLGNWSSSESRFTPGERSSSWIDGLCLGSGRHFWVVLRNLTPQIDGSTLRTLCMQHGPLVTFHLHLHIGTAVVCYSTRDEAIKAQKSLHMCVLGNTTILADCANDEEVRHVFAQGQSLGWQVIGAPLSRMDQSHPFPVTIPEPTQWSSGDLNTASLWSGPNYSNGLWGSSSGTDAGSINNPSQISSFLPVDHLNGSGDSM
ncbi:trinucleotide repeat-containing gene 6A protein-like isoform 2-T3 [Pholidichthys leucotaenia]